MSAVDKTFGTRFAAARKTRGLSQEAVISGLLERGIDLHVTAIGKIERGERRVTVGEANALASILGYTLDGLLGGGGGLVTAYAVGNTAGRALTSAAREYARSLLAIAHQADVMDQPMREEDVRWLRHVMPTQTPAQYVREMTIHARAELAQLGYNPDGRYMRILLDAIERDELALRSSLPTPEETKRAMRGSDG